MASSYQWKTADEVGDYTIPAGARVFMNQWVVHRDARWYDDPLAFRPDRWTKEFEKSLPSFAYFPFGGGPRRCIGDRFAMLEARIILASIYQDYHLELASDRNLEVIPTITSRPKEDVLTAVHERSTTEPATDKWRPWHPPRICMRQLMRRRAVH
nr:cytochrome P450 [Halomarina rubra]